MEFFPDKIEYFIETSSSEGAININIKDIEEFLSTL